MKTLIEMKKTQTMT